MTDATPEQLVKGFGIGCLSSLFIWAALGAVIFSLSGCGQPRRADAPTTGGSETEQIYVVDVPTEMDIYVDPDTGCEYIKYKGTYETSITPRMYFSQYYNRNEQKGCKPQ